MHGSVYLKRHTYTFHMMNSTGIQFWVSWSWSLRTYPCSTHPTHPPHTQDSVGYYTVLFSNVPPKSYLPGCKKKMLLVINSIFSNSKIMKLPSVWDWKHAGQFVYHSDDDTFVLVFSSQLLPRICHLDVSC